jgi:hypothetical protein
MKATKLKLNNSKRAFVPDLSPEARVELARSKPKLIFVAESPHIHEIEPIQQLQRRPLCGKAGRQWWGALSTILEGPTGQSQIKNQINDAVDLPRLIQLCRDYEMAVINAVQWPLDPKIATRFPEADPLKTVGFHKCSGEFSYKRLKSSMQVQKAMHSLARRLRHPAVAHAKIYCLGNDAQWFVQESLEEQEWKLRVQEKIPHPSAWWRRGGYFGRVAQDRLTQCLNVEVLAQLQKSRLSDKIGS